MDHLWSPWRFGYVTKSIPISECPLCDMSVMADEEHWVVHRGEHCFVVLNRFPYAPGHLMIAPKSHLAMLADCSPATLHELMELAQQAEAHLRAEYQCPGLNMGFNLGACAGAGIPGHLHFHVVPRWPGDVNFMTAIGETRTLPEDLRTTWMRLRKRWSVGV